MSSDWVVKIHDVSKAYTVYEKPEDRLKQMLWRQHRKYYKEFWALRDINLDIYRGETLGIIGRNGSGKSTLLQLICGTLHPTWGQIEVRGRVAALLELGAGFNPEFTGMENLFLNASILGLSQNEIHNRVDRIAAFADIGDFLKQPVKTYSSGMYARLEFAVAVHVDPEVLIVDEILAVGDAAFQRKCVQRFYEIKEQGATILFVSHDSYQVKNLCDRAIYLIDGVPRAVGAAAEVVDQYTFDLERGSIARRIESTATEEHLAEKPKTEKQENEPTEIAGQLFSITDVLLENSEQERIEVVQSGETIRLRIHYKATEEEFPSRISFVFNLYRHDDLYVCGVTSLMDELEPFTAYRSGEVVVEFPNFPLTAGRYVWRVAINDAGGLLVHAHAKYVCPFQVIDQFRAVGVVNLEHRWSTSALDCVA
jgi:lipopolysaccharide transport system ATP-binding protein